MTSSSEPTGAMPEAIGPYRVEERIGGGGMGEVYRGYDARLDRPVALKHVKGDAKDPAAARERFRREARALARVRHPAVVEVYDWVEGEDGDWIIMELLEGRPLASWIAEGPLEVRRALEIARDVAAGLAAVHAHGIVHRDLNPANVMWVPAGRASAGHIKIVDFGLAKRVESMDGVPLTETISRAGQLVGTVRYMSPEQAAGRGVDPRSDLFSLGVVLYEMLTGASPFQGATAVETLTRICTVAETPVHDRDPAVPAAVSELVERLLRKESERRLQSAAEVAETLESLAAGVAAGRPDEELRAALPEAGSDSDVTSPTLVAERAPGSSAAGAPITGDVVHRTGLEETPLSSGVHVRTLLLNDLIDSTRLVETLGDERAAEIFEQHDRRARDLLKRCRGREIDKADGFLMLFERPLDAVRFALGYHAALAELSEREGVAVSSRVGIHVGEVVLRVSSAEDVAQGAKPLEVEGLAKAMAARLMSLAGAGQTLISRGVYDLARRAAVGAAEVPEGLCWVEHGRYRMQGVKEPVEVFEAGVEGSSPLAAPKDTKKVRRVVKGPGRLLRDRRSHWAAAAALVAASIAGWTWWQSIPEPLAVAVLAPKVGTVDGSVDSALVASAIRGALTAGLLSYEAVSLTPADQVDVLEGSSAALARALAVDEVVVADFDCAQQMCQVSLSRVAGDSGNVVWGANFPSRADDLLVLHAAVEQNFRRGYAERRVSQGAADLEVRAEDYRTFLELERDHETTRALSSEEILGELSKLHLTSPRFLDAYLLEAIVAIRRFYDTRDPALFDTALHACRTAREMAPADLRPLSLLASVARDAGDLELWQEALDRLKDLTVGDPGTLALEALLREKTGDQVVALRTMREAARLRPSWQMLRELGMMEYRNGDVPAARASLEAARELVPEHLVVLSELAQIELLSGDPHRAVAHYEALVEQSPGVGHLANLGVSYFLLERYADAAPVFRRALQKAPGSPPLLLNLADAEQLLGREDAAKLLYQKVVESLAEDAFGASWQGKTIGAQAQAHLGEVELAVAACQEALRLAPDNPQVALEVAMVYALIGEHASALVNVERALRGGVDPRWFRFPWFGSLRQTPRFQQLVEAGSTT